MVQLTKEEIVNITMRLQSVRQGLVQKAPFYAILLFGLRFSLDDMVERVYTDGERIAFNPDFLKEISDRELEFIMLHEVSHVALGHPFRCMDDYDIDLFDEACDIVVNSNIYHYVGNDDSFLNITGLGIMPHQNYDGEEGYKFTVEQVYDHLVKRKGIVKKDDGTKPDKSNHSEDEQIGQGGDSQDTNGKDGQDQADQSGTDNQGGQGCQGGKGSPGQGGASLKGGFVQALDKWDFSKTELCESRAVHFDDHSFWKGGNEPIAKATWQSRVLQTYQAVKNIKKVVIDKRGKTWGDCPAFAERVFAEISERKLDWKTLLNDFIQEDICDYSFSPPDRRFGDSDFFLPDFNEKEDSVENLLFMIDTSASMSDQAISEVYSEIKGAIEQFNGKLKGWLGFFDAIVTEPVPFEDEEEFSAIRGLGGGGTAFLPIFEYVRDNMKDQKISSIIILTDGYAPYPEEYERMDIPVLWVINNEESTPPWGMIARIPQKKEDF